MCAEQLRSFLGMVNYYRKFLPHLTSTLTPSYNLLKRHTPWGWDHDEDRAIKRAKQPLTSAKVLTPYNPEQKLIL